MLLELKFSWNRRPPDLNKDGQNDIVRHKVTFQFGKGDQHINEA